MLPYLPVVFTNKSQIRFFSHDFHIFLLSNIPENVLLSLATNHWKRQSDMFWKDFNGSGHESWQFNSHPWLWVHARGHPICTQQSLAVDTKNFQKKFGDKPKCGYNSRKCVRLRSFFFKVVQSCGPLCIINVKVVMMFLIMAHLVLKLHTKKTTLKRECIWETDYSLFTHNSLSVALFIKK